METCKCNKTISTDPQYQMKFNIKTKGTKSKKLYIINYPIYKYFIIMF